MRDLQELESLSRKINRQCFHGRVPRASIRLSRRLQRAGQVTYRTRVIDISVSYHDRYGWGRELERTLKHEMLHLYLHAAGKNSGHTPLFRDWCRKIGAMYHCRDFSPPDRYVYRCPQGHLLRTKRRLSRDSSCALCDTHFNPHFRVALHRVLSPPKPRKAAVHKKRKVSSHARQPTLFS